MSVRFRSERVEREFDLVICDCDGVLFNSNALKTAAFRFALRDHPPSSVDDLVAYHQHNGGVSRYAKFDYFFGTIARLEHSAAPIESALADFGDFVSRGYAELRPVPEALDFVRAVRSRAAVYVVSGSDQEELRQVFSLHGIRDDFRDVLGSPVAKTANVKDVMARETADPMRTVIIGDGKADFDASVAVGCHFVYLASMSEWTGASAILNNRRDVTVAPSWRSLAGMFAQ
jgi:phosphoglycolate phosphatase-like HAD superfamily hydrolase